MAVWEVRDFEGLAEVVGYPFMLLLHPKSW